jgi:hypothetical protein
MLFDASSTRCATIFAGSRDTADEAHRAVLHEATIEGAVAGRDTAQFPTCSQLSAKCRSR